MLYTGLRSKERVRKKEIVERKTKGIIAGLILLLVL